MSEFPAYQSAPQYSGLVPSLVPALRGRSVFAISAVGLATLASVAVAVVPELLTSDAQAIIAATGAYFVASLVAGIAWIMWQYRARTNLDGFGMHDLQWTPGWSIGGWFIPLANFVVPILIVNEIDKVSATRAAAATEPGIGWSGRDTSRPIFILWAVAWPLRAVASYLALAVQSASPLGAMGLKVVIELGAGVAAILLILRITDNQEKVRNSRPAEMIVGTPAPPAAAVWPDAAV